MRPRGKLLLTSHNSRPKGRTSSMPTGHDNSTSLMSSPIAFRASGSSSFNHSRSGSLPLSRAVEARRQALESRIHTLAYHFWYPWSNTFSGGNSVAMQQQHLMPNRLSMMCSRRNCSYWRHCEREWGGEVPES